MTCLYVVCHISCIGAIATASLVVGITVRRTIDANPSLCTPDDAMDNNTINATNVADVGQPQFDYPDCPASLDIAITMTFVSALFMVST